MVMLFMEIDEKEFKDIKEMLKLADEMVDALHRFDDWCRVVMLATIRSKAS